MDFLSVRGVSSEDADKAVDAGLDGPGSGKVKGIVAGGGREDWPDAVGNAIGYSEPVLMRGGVSGVAGGIENPSRNVDMGSR